MDDAGIERRLSVILAADVVGYSRLMELDCGAAPLRLLQVAITKTRMEVYACVSLRRCVSELRCFGLLFAQYLTTSDVQVCEDYRHREHSLQPTSLRPDFEIIPDKHLTEGARVLAPHSDGLWYSARIVSTSNDIALRARNKLQVRCCWHTWLEPQPQPRRSSSPMTQNIICR